MATYNKRGYKPAKEKVEKAENEVIEATEDISVLEKNSTTAGVFSKLDESASKTEDFVAKYQKIILGVVGAIALTTIGYIAYQKFVLTPKEDDATEQMYLAQQNFQKATEGTDSEKLYKLALDGADGKWGFLKIAEEFAGTDAGNLANYYAGISLLNTKKYDDAISYLEKFKSEDLILSALAKGAIGDAYAQKNQPNEALEFYIKAFEHDKNDFVTPRFLMKAGKTALALGKKEEALKYFTDIKENFESTPEASAADVLIGMAQ